MAETNLNYSCPNGVNVLVEKELKTLVLDCRNSVPPDEIQMAGQHAFPELYRTESHRFEKCKENIGRCIQEFGLSKAVLLAQVLMHEPRYRAVYIVRIG